MKSKSKRSKERQHEGGVVEGEEEEGMRREPSQRRDEGSNRAPF